MGEFILAAVMVINDTRRGGGVRVDDVIVRLFTAGAGNFAGMMVERQMHAFHIRQVGGDVGTGNQDRTVLHVLGMDELDIVDQVQFFEEHRADQAVEIAAGDQTEFIAAHSSLPLILTALTR